MKCKRKKYFSFKKYFIFIILLLLLELRNIEKKKIFVKTSKLIKVSVFLPIYNKEKYLFRSINSIQSQSLKNIEIIAVNDGSTDNTLKILIFLFIDT